MLRTGGFAVPQIGGISTGSGNLNRQDFPSPSIVSKSLAVSNETNVLFESLQRTQEKRFWYTLSDWSDVLSLRSSRSQIPSRRRQRLNHLWHLRNKLHRPRAHPWWRSQRNKQYEVLYREISSESQSQAQLTPTHPLPTSNKLSKRKDC